jgi:hypothetical protein
MAETTDRPEPPGALAGRFLDAAGTALASFRELERAAGMLARGMGTFRRGGESLMSPSVAELRETVRPAAAEALRSLETLGSLYPELRPLLPPETWKTVKTERGRTWTEDKTPLFAALFGDECRWALDQAADENIVRIPKLARLSKLAGLRPNFEALEALVPIVRRFRDEAIEREHGEIRARSRVLTRGFDELIHAAARIPKDDADQLAGPAKKPFICSRAALAEFFGRSPNTTGIIDILTRLGEIESCDIISINMVSVILRDDERHREASKKFAPKPRNSRARKRRET